MVVVVVIVAAWVVILGPGVVKRRARAGGHQSIHHFHHQLQILEHSAPEPIVAPAFRLRGTDEPSASRGVFYPGSGERPVLTVVGAKDLPRPALAFLGDPAPVIEHGGPDAGTAPEVDVVGVPSGVRIDQRGFDLANRQATRRRRRDTLLVLAGMTAVLLLAAAATGSAAAWVLTVMAGLVLVGYVALLFQLHQRALEREAKLHYLDAHRAEPWGPVDEGLPVYGVPSTRPPVVRRGHTAIR